MWYRAVLSFKLKSRTGFSPRSIARPVLLLPRNSRPRGWWSSWTRRRRNHRRKPNISERESFRVKRLLARIPSHERKQDWFNFFFFSRDFVSSFRDFHARCVLHSTYNKQILFYTGRADSLKYRGCADEGRLPLRRYLSTIHKNLYDIFLSLNRETNFDSNVAVVFAEISLLQIERCRFNESLERFPERTINDLSPKKKKS